MTRCSRPAAASALPLSVAFSPVPSLVHGPGGGLAGINPGHGTRNPPAPTGGNWRADPGKPAGRDRLYCRTQSYCVRTLERARGASQIAVAARIVPATTPPTHPALAGTPLAHGGGGQVGRYRGSRGDAGCRTLPPRATGGCANQEGRGAMGLDNVAVQWPRTGRFYEPVAPAEFVDFATLAEKVPATAPPAAALADHIAETGTVRATGYSQLVDLLLG